MADSVILIIFVIFIVLALVGGIIAIILIQITKKKDDDSPSNKFLIRSSNNKVLWTQPILNEAYLGVVDFSSQLNCANLEFSHTDDFIIAQTPATQNQKLYFRVEVGSINLCSSSTAPNTKWKYDENNKTWCLKNNSSFCMTYDDDGTPIVKSLPSPIPSTFQWDLPSSSTCRN